LPMLGLLENNSNSDGAQNRNQQTKE